MADLVLEESRAADELNNTDSLRTRSRSRSREESRNRSRSRSRSPTRRSDSRSGSFRTKNNKQFPEAPPSRVLGIFGLNPRTGESELKDLFDRFGVIESVSVVFDRRSRTSRGFGFVYFKNQEDAERARAETNGTMLDSRQIRVDFSATKGPHDPTPGRYMGRHRSPDRYRRSRSRSRSRDRRRRSRSHSRSRSHRHGSHRSHRSRSRESRRSRSRSPRRSR